MVEEQNPCAGKHVIERIHCENFAYWFLDHVKQIQVADGVDISKDLKLLARGPNNVGRTYQKILVNGFRFHTRQLESQRKTQNSGVLVNATTSSFLSTKDNNPILSDLAYYGILTNILELNYTEGRTVTLFECDWISKGKRLKQDEDRFTLANFKNVKPHPEPYVIATQVSQVFYVEDPLADMFEKRLGYLPSRVDMFEHCYTDSNGNPGNDDVAATLQALKEKVSQLPPGSNDDVGRNDAFAQVFGEDNNGCVRMYGLGVTPSDKWGDVPSRSTCQRIVMEQKAAISKMEDKFAEQDQQLKDQAKELAELKAMVCQQQNSGSKTGGSINSTSSNHVSKSPMGARSLQEGDWVDIFSLFDPTKCLAIGRFQGIDPSKVVRGQPLGPCWCEILVQIVMERNEQLIRPYGLLQTIEDALGAPIAWPLKLVKIHVD